MADKCYLPRVRQYYCRKYAWDEASFSSVNWDAIEGAMARCTPSTAKWVTKYSSGFIGTAKTLARRDYWLDKTCPMCQCTTEDNMHVICCPQPAQRQMLHRQLDELYDWLEYVRFSPSMISEIKRINNIWINDQTLPGVTSTVPAIQHQLHIGWKHLFFGRTHHDITYNLHHHYTRLGFKRHAQSTMSMFIYKMWTMIIRPLWNSRNRKVHAMDLTTSQTRVQQDLRTEITEMYQNTNNDMLFHKDRHLFEISLEELLKKNDSYLYSWRDEVDIATKQSSSSATTIDPTQRTIYFHLPQHNRNIHMPEPVADAESEAIMTPVQRRIHRRRKNIPAIQTPHPTPCADQPLRPPTPPPAVPKHALPNEEPPPLPPHPPPLLRRQHRIHSSPNRTRAPPTKVNNTLSAHLSPRQRTIHSNFPHQAPTIQLTAPTENDATELELTPVQRHTHQRRNTASTIRTQHPLSRTVPSRRTSPPPPSVPQIALPNEGPTPEPTQSPPTRRCHRRVQNSTSQPRTTPTVTANIVPAPIPTRTHTGTLHHFWSHERERQRLMRGSWRPP